MAATLKTATRHGAGVRGSSSVAPCIALLRSCVLQVAASLSDVFSNNKDRSLGILHSLNVRPPGVIPL